jgi:hypothetical protein
MDTKESKGSNFGVFLATFGVGGGGVPHLCPSIICIKIGIWWAFKWTSSFVASELMTIVLFFQKIFHGCLLEMKTFLPPLVAFKKFQLC